VDRSDVEDVAVAMVTALLELDFETGRILVLPEQRDTIATLEQAAALGGSPNIEIVDIAATVVEQRGTTAIVDYSGRYCLPETMNEVEVTAVGSDGEGVRTVPGSSLVVTEPGRCFDLDEVFQTDDVELALIDGAWYAPLPG
jgi:hypothetical protein